MGILSYVRFQTTVELGGKTATGMQIPDDVVATLGPGRRPAVRITVGGHTYRTTVASMGGRFLVPLSAENRTAAGVAAGDEVDVDIELDDAPREIEVAGEQIANLLRVAMLGKRREAHQVREEHGDDPTLGDR